MALNATDAVTHPDGALTDGFTLTVDALQANGVDKMYGVVGIPVTDLARIAQAKGIRYIGFRQEQAAGHAAVAVRMEHPERVMPRQRGGCHGSSTSGPVARTGPHPMEQK